MVKYGALLDYIDDGARLVFCHLLRVLLPPPIDYLQTNKLEPQRYAIDCPPPLLQLLIPYPISTQDLVDLIIAQSFKYKLIPYLIRKETRKRLPGWVEYIGCRKLG